MGKCEVCGNQCGEGYSLCMSCNIKNKSANVATEVVKKLEFMNWNFGAISKDLNLYITYNITDKPELKKKIVKHFEELAEKNIETSKKIESDKDGEV